MKDLKYIVQLKIMVMDLNYYILLKTIKCQDSSDLNFIFPGHKNPQFCKIKTSAYSQKQNKTKLQKCVAMLTQQ